MTLRSTARDAYHVALDFWGCLRRFVDGKAVNGYDDHMAEVLAEAGGKQAGRDLGQALDASRLSGAITPRVGYRGVVLTDGTVRVERDYDGPQPGEDPMSRLASVVFDLEQSLTDLTSAAPGTASPAAAAERPASSGAATSAAADAGHLTSSAAHSQTADERPEATPPASGPPTFTAAELVDAAGAVTRMALLRGVASGNVAYWLALSAKFYDAADAIGDASTPPEYTTQLATIGRDALLETLGNDPASAHDRALRDRLDEDERQK